MMAQSSSVLSKPSAINAEFIYTVRSVRKSLLLLKEIYVPSRIFRRKVDLFISR